MINYNFSRTKGTHTDIATHAPAYSLKNNAGSARCLTLVCPLTDRTSNKISTLDVSFVGMQHVAPSSALQENSMCNSGFIISKSHASDEYALLYVTKGCGELYLNKCMRESITVKAGTLCWIPAGQWYVCKPNRKHGCTIYYIHITGSVVEQAIRHLPLEGQSTFLNIGFNDELSGLFKRADELQHLTESFKRTYLAGIALHMIGLVLANAKCATAQTDSNGQKMEEAKAIMKENVMNDIDMSQLAMSLQLSYSWFRKLFKNYCGTSPAHYFTALKIEKLKSLIASTSTPVNELIAQLNCGTVENFYKAFKKHTGYTPSEYRALISAQTDKHLYTSNLLIGSKMV